MLLSEIRRDDKFEGFLIVRSAEQRAAALLPRACSRGTFSCKSRAFRS